MKPLQHKYLNTYSSNDTTNIIKTNAYTHAPIHLHARVHCIYIHKHMYIYAKSSLLLCTSQNKRSNRLDVNLESNTNAHSSLRLPLVLRRKDEYSRQCIIAVAVAVAAVYNVQ